MKKLNLLLFISFILPLGIFAHPHIYIDLSIKIEIDDQGIVGFWENWAIVNEFGENISKEYDRNNDGFFSIEETESVKRDLFDNIAKYNYYTYLDINEKLFIPSQIESFSVSKGNEGTIFRFFIPCRISSDTVNTTCELSIIDWSKYISFGLRYIDDPTTSTVQYKVNIERRDEYYSHSSIFGSAIVIISMIDSDENRDHGVSASGPLTTESERTHLRRLTPVYDAPSETSLNPFVSPGVRIKDDNPNPFLTY